MHDGSIVQIDSPEALYERPNSRYVANFVGRTNLLDVVVREKFSGGLVRVETDSKASFFVATEHATIDVGTRCLLGARPEHFHFGAGRANTIVAKVRGATYLGSTRYVDAEGPDGRSFVVQVPPGEPVPARGEVVNISWRAESCFLLKQ
jgi:ABC-type Fe3+/spermidine/putrescine transport system ATPase subunit